MEPWKKLGAEQVFKKYGRAIERRDFLLPNGQKSDFYVQTCSPTVCVLAMTPKNEVILAEQFRVGPEAVLLELPGGGVGADETPEKAIARELLEETGYAGALQFIGKCLVDAYSNADHYCFVAKNCVKVAEQKLDENEFVQVKIMPLPEFIEYLRSGRLSNVSGAYMALDFLGLL